MGESGPFPTLKPLLSERRRAPSIGQPDGSGCMSGVICSRSKRTLLHLVACLVSDQEWKIC